MKQTSPVVGMEKVRIKMAVAIRLKKDKALQLPGGFQLR
jgi:hypothetical protein